MHSQFNCIISGTETSQHASIANSMHQWCIVNLLVAITPLSYTLVKTILVSKCLGEDETGHECHGCSGCQGLTL